MKKIQSCLRFGVLTAVLVSGYGPAALAQIPLNLAPSRALGHSRLALTSTDPNLVEGREFNRPQGVAVDTSTSPPALYVADTFNNRVLGWRDAAAFENGGKADIVIGQRDFLTTVALGPGTSFASGLNTPMNVAVDASGNLFVVDGGNNRVVRYSKPFAQPDAIKLADMAIGQPGLNSRAPGLSERALAFTSAAGIFRAAIAFDNRGNLWVSDAANHRAVRFPASALSEGAASGPASDLILGQPDARTNTAPPLTLAAANRLNRSTLRAPSGLAFDQGGRLFVVDNLNRVLVFVPPFTNAMPASRFLGIPQAPEQGQPAPPPITEFTLGIAIGTTIVPPEGVFAVGNSVFVTDSPTHRILRYPPFERWAPEAAAQISPAAEAVIGQDVMRMSEIRPNRGLAEPNDRSFFNPIAGYFHAGETFIVDSDNNRVLVFGDISTGPALSSGPPYTAKRLLGQIGFEYRAANLVEGREFNFSSFGAAGAGLAIDSRSNPPRLYVADTLNHRVLAFADARRVRTGDKADLVIGQPDFFRTGPNFPIGNTGTRNNTGLALPIGVAVDRDGNLWVADSGNGRVLRFPNPFANTAQVPLQADLVLGQSSFTTRVTDATARTTAGPYGLAFTAEGFLLVSDTSHSRVLMFNSPFSTGMAASRVFGQPDFNSSISSNTDNRFSGPRHIAVDSDDRLYVCDAGNNRVMIFSRAPLAGPDPRAAFQLSRGLRSPLGITVSPATGEIWVGHITTASAPLAVRYPRFDRLLATGDTPDYIIPTPSPLALLQDPFGNLLVADVANRVAIYYPALRVVNGANYLTRIAPGMVTTLQNNGLNYSFTDQTVVFNELPNPVPLPQTLGDLQVEIEGSAVPMYFVSPFQINFLMPNAAPTTGTIEVLVVQPSTGRVVAATQVRMDVASPALFTLNSSGTGQVAAINQDGTINGVGTGFSAVPRSQVITLFGTGQGPIPNAPPDGSPAEGVIETPDRPVVIVGGIRLNDSEILYSGLAPGLIGVWQLNIMIPDRVPPNNAHVVVMTMNDIPSNNPQNPAQIRTTIAVR